MAVPLEIRTLRELPRRLGLADSLAIVVGTIIGSAIFVVPGSISQNLPSPLLVYAVWIASGVLSLFGALAFAELGAMLPATGGQYVYLREAYGPLWAFLCGWSYFVIIRSGGIATVAVGFAIYLGVFLPMSPLVSRLTAAALIGILTVVNYRGIHGGALVQKIFTALKLIGLVALIASAFVVPPLVKQDWSIPAGSFSWSRFGVAMIACLWAYNGWMAIGFVAGEIRRPERNLPRSLGIGMAVVTVIYLLANIAFFRALPVPQIAGTERVAALTATQTMGMAGAVLVTITILISTVGTTNGNILTASRVYFAQARDGLFFRSAGNVHRRFETPSVAILIQGIWSAVLALSGSYERLFAFATFAAWIFYGMAVIGVMVLRRKQPDAPRPYRMWGYPATPLLFGMVTVWFVSNTLIERPGPSLLGLVLIATGVPVYYYWKKRAAADMLP